MVKIVGILNVTPDSFSDGGHYFEPSAAIKHAVSLFADGADLIDVGAESTRPNAEPLSDEEEWQRLELILPVLLKKYPGKISLDTYHPATVRRAVSIGPIIVNDVTGMADPEMIRAVTDTGSKVVISHLPGKNIQQAHADMPITSVEQVKHDLLAKAEELIEMGLPKSNIILDPGIGFGKIPEINQQLLEFAKNVPEFPVMVGYSRKRFLGEHRMEIEPNLAAGRVAIESGATYLRVHDVAAHKKLINTVQ